MVMNPTRNLQTPAGRFDDPVLTTERLVLREMTPDDLDFVAEMMGHPEVTRYYPKQYSREEARHWLERQRERYRRDGHGLWLVTLKSTGEAVGQVGLAIQDVDGVREPEVGWLLHRAYWGNGYATEAGAAARDAAFERWRYPHVISLIRPENVPSQRVATRIGLQPGRRVLFHGFVHIVYRSNRLDRSDRSDRS
jgi:RimJ/RimL family protein N-acetyltransferase